MKKIYLIKQLLVIKKFSLFVVLCFFSYVIKAQTTYTWAVDTGYFLSPSSWIPARNNPDTNDVLVFDGNTQALAIVNNIRTQTIGKLLIKNNATVSFASAIPDTLSEIEVGYSIITGNKAQLKNKLRVNDVISDSTFFIRDFVKQFFNDSTFNTEYRNFSSNSSPAYLPKLIFPKLIIKSNFNVLPSFEIEKGSKLALNCAPVSLNIYLETGTFADIKGMLCINGISDSLSSYSCLVGIDSNSIRVKYSGCISVNSFATAFNFGLYGSSTRTYFDSASCFNVANRCFLRGVVFNKGSNLIMENGYMGNYKFANVVLKNVNSLLRSAEFENLIIEKGNFYVWSASVKITGSLTVLPGASFSIHSSWGNILANTTISFNGDQPQTIGGGGSFNIVSSNSSTVSINFKNPKGIFLNNNLNLSNSQVLLDTGFVNLNGYNLTIGEDSMKCGNLKVKNGYFTGNGTLTKWYPANNLVTSNLDSTLFPFGFENKKRNIWITGNITSSGTISISHRNNEGMYSFVNPFSDNNTTVKNRQNYYWEIKKSEGLKASNLTLMAQGNVDSGYTNLPTNIRLTLAQEKAPGLALNGTGTALFPVAIRTNLADSSLNNTFYLGANSTICVPPVPPIVSNKTICPNTFTSLSAIGSGVVSWYSDSVGGNYLGSGLSFTTPILSNLTNYYVQDSTCAASPRTKVTVFVLPKPPIGFTINNKSQCVNNNQFVFTDTSAVGQGNITRLWKINGTDTFTAASFTQKFNTIGNYTVQLIAINSINNSCSDSVTKTFVVNPKPTVLINANATVVCEGQPVTLNGNGAQTYFWSNGVLNGIAFYPIVNKTYTVIGSDSNNCADTATINITVNKKPVISASASINPVCAKVPIVLTGSGGIHYFWSDGILNGVPFVPVSSKTYLLTALNSDGCSDTASVNLVVKPLPSTSTTKNKTMITATQTGAAYQWLNCNNSKSAIIGANNQSYTATINGNYAVIVTQNGCSDTSVCVNINSVSFNEKSVENNISIYPNPANNKLNIGLGSQFTNQLTINFYDSKGSLAKSITKVNQNNLEIDMNDLTQGLYLIEILNDGKRYVSKLIKE
jgi:hypothetical protein